MANEADDTEAENAKPLGQEGALAVVEGDTDAAGATPAEGRDAGAALAEAAMTGHQVWTTIHANDAVAKIETSDVGTWSSRFMMPAPSRRS